MTCPGGAPIAHEDRARRAVHAALGIGRALETYQTELAPRGISFRARHGLNTGLVVVGSIGSDLRMDTARHRSERCRGASLLLGA